ncbi:MULTISPECIES: OmpA family protein [Pseudomonas]|uniref:Outer membrane porin OprF n=1 Tax=Pseudomonas chlororaphis TaxID=587753 RepID=A0AAX3G2I1_9PSED|nr:MULTISPECIES: OmpA family protein [Pseudomonas]AZC36372.1 Nonspecific porin and structural outer membrane protein OprF [Pseudomonas chlororaphis subsp. piscium]AZC42917.1 Nonspecific porin and structural outer membrane protein OprF [Pseudomonas chlororaphis subsp. piscium]AZC49558.1 Nonspecific porin and structural outer membrane protein OprF [Pseudomonas chlororaphis subsp. piscium]AZC56140.1 Nonspecific porin and structural outer membrane protein OprF [Pseudomonas chlororaphis subsp. pisci
MKLKNTLGIAIGSIVAVTSFGVLAQGQGAVEGELFYKKQYNDSVKHIEDGFNPGARIGYFLTDDLSLDLNYDKTNHTRSNDGTGNQKIKGDTGSLLATYHFGQAGVDSLRPYVSGGFGHQSRTNVLADGHSGRDQSTLAIIGTGVKYYFTDNLFARAGVEADYAMDNGKWDYSALVGLGVNFGGNAGKVAPAPAPVPEPTPEPEAPVAEVVRVELDVKFDFDKSVVKPNSYADIKNLADFMKQYPQTTTVVEGHTDSVGPDAYNQKLSERRANAVKQVLTSQYGVESSRVQSVGYGESRPVADNATEAGRAVNRRVEAQVEAQAQPAQ